MEKIWIFSGFLQLVPERTSIMTWKAKIRIILAWWPFYIIFRIITNDYKNFDKLLACWSPSGTSYYFQEEVSTCSSWTLSIFMSVGVISVAVVPYVLSGRWCVHWSGTYPGSQLRLVRSGVLSFQWEWIAAIQSLDAYGWWFLETLVSGPAMPQMSLKLAQYNGIWKW